MLTLHHLKEIESFCCNIAIKAGNRIMEIYNDESAFANVEYKSDNSPLTLADKEANNIIVSALTSRFPTYAILSEEKKDDLKRLQNEYCFIVDPLDGTKEFIKRNDEFTVNIALSYKHNVILGVIYIPVSKELYFASKENGSFYQDALGNISRINVSDETDLTKVKLVMSSSHGCLEMDEIINKYNFINFLKIGSSIKGCLIAKGEAEIYYRHNPTMEWDTAAMQCIVEEAGGIFRQMDGSLMQYNRKNSLNDKGFFIVNKCENILHEIEVNMITHLDRLEAEAIYIMREVAAECERPVMMYSIGKDSSVMLHLAKKAFYPGKIPFPLLHIDTTWKFKEMIDFRDKTVAQNELDLIVYTNPQGIKDGINPFDHGSAYTDIMKTEALKQALDTYKFTAALGGGRRDEELSRAKERIFSFRDNNHVWNPKKQRPELWNLYNTKINKGESIRVFPLSNWTESDIWQYILRENIEIVPLYFAKNRPVVKRDGNLIMVDDERMKLLPDEVVQEKSVRFRTLGCYPLTGAIISEANNLHEIITETLGAVNSERNSRVIDHEVRGSMERRKKEGYF